MQGQMSVMCLAWWYHRAPGRPDMRLAGDEFADFTAWPPGYHDARTVDHIRMVDGDSMLLGTDRRKSRANEVVRIGDGKDCSF